MFVNLNDTKMIISFSLNQIQWFIQVKDHQRIKGNQFDDNSYEHQLCKVNTKQTEDWRGNKACGVMLNEQKDRCSWGKCFYWKQIKLNREKDLMWS